jgi:hypothetical protein
VYADIGLRLRIPLSGISKQLWLVSKAHEEAVRFHSMRWLQELPPLMGRYFAARRYEPTADRDRSGLT